MPARVTSGARATTARVRSSRRLWSAKGGRGLSSMYSGVAEGGWQDIGVRYRPVLQEPAADSPELSAAVQASSPG